MKRISSLLIALLFLLNGFAVFADVVFAPESDFYDMHRKECESVFRDYYSNGPEGYIGLYKQPDGQLTQYITNAQQLHIAYTYQDWGMISYIGGYAQNVDKWVKMEELYLIYDEQSFCKEHEKEFTKTHYQLSAGAEENKKIYIYNYPGAKNPRTFNLSNDTLDLGTAYKDPEGRIWGKIFYHYGIRNSWVCISNPTAVIEPFGGDPALETFENYASNITIPEVESEEQPEPAPDTSVSNDDPAGADIAIPAPSEKEEPEIDIPEPETEIFQPNPEDVEVYLPVDPPLRIPLNPIIPIAIGLVTVAVIAAVVLIIVCYKKKH